MAAIARNGVSLRNSHSLFPTFTTANASAWRPATCSATPAISPTRSTPAFKCPAPATASTPFLESDAVLGDVDEHFAGNYLDEATILKLARDKGYSTASIGKIGPTLIFDPTERRAVKPSWSTTRPARPRAFPLSPEVTQRLKAANLPLATPSRGANGAAGNVTTPGTHTANVVQQDYFAAVTTRVVLPLFKERNKPFVLVFWSRDPDGTQHNQGDSLNRLVPGINGPTSLAAIRNADDDLARIRAALDELGLLDYHRHHRHRRSWLLDDLQGKPDKPGGEDQIRRHAARPPAAGLRRARSRARAQDAADRSRRRLQDHRRRRSIRKSATG